MDKANIIVWTVVCSSVARYECMYIHACELIVGVKDIVPIM